MLEQIADSRMLEEEFFTQPFKFSYSGLNKLLHSPQAFYKHYILRQREDRTDAHLIEGKVIHSLLLEDGSFDRRFILSPVNLPSDNVRSILNRVFTIYEDGRAAPPDTRESLGDYSVEIIQMLEEVNLYQSLVDDKKPDKNGVQRTGNQKRLEKIITEQNNSYFEFLKLKGNRELIDAETLDKCTIAVEILRENGKVHELLGINKENTDWYSIYNEILLEIPKLDSLPFGLRGIIDNMTVDVDKTQITINDIKTTSKTISEFKESVEYYRYWIQAVIYKRLALHYLREVNIPKWKVVFNFIVLDKYNQVYPFQVSDQTFAEWEAKVDIELNKAGWHLTNRQFNLPYEFAQEGQIML